MVVYVTESDRLPTLSLISLSASSISSSSRRRAYNNVSNNNVNNDTNTCININNYINDNNIINIKTKRQKKQIQNNNNKIESYGWKHIQDIVPISVGIVKCELV